MKEFFEAIRAGNTAAVESLLESDPGLVTAADDSGLGPLAVAVYHRQPEIATLLENRGAQLDIFTAAMCSRPEKLRDCLAESPDSVNSFSADGWTPLHLAAFFGCAECTTMLLDAGAKINERAQNPMQNMPLHAASAGRHAEIVRILLERGAWVNARQHGGWTALHAAAQNGDTQLAQLLIAAGADVKVRADNQQTPLDLALTKGHQQLSEILDHYGASQ